MALYGVSFTLTYVAWDTANNVGKTGDAANHTLRWIKDGVAASPTNTPIEVDAVNAPGIYKIVLTSTETQAIYGTLAGKSSTPGVSIMPVSVAFEQLPNAAPGASGGLPVLDANGLVAANAKAISDSVAAANNLETNITYLDAAVSTRLASAAYVVPDNTGIAAIKAQTDKLTFDAANRVVANATSVWDELRSNHTTTGTFGAVSEWSGAGLTPQQVANAVWNEVRSGHNTIGTFGAVNEWAGGASAADIWSYATRTLTAATNITSNGAPIDQTKIDNLDAAVSSRLPSTSYVAPDNVSITAIKAQTDKLQFDAMNRVIADAQAISASTIAADTLEANIGNLDAAVSSRLSQVDIPTITLDVFSNTIETGITFKNLCQVLGAVIAGQITTAGTDTEVFKAIGNAAVTRVIVSVDSAGNRTNVTFSF